MEKLKQTYIAYHNSNVFQNYFNVYQKKFLNPSTCSPELLPFIIGLSARQHLLYTFQGVCMGRQKHEIFF